MNLRWLMRMSMWARRPPSRQQIIIVACAIGGALILFGIEALGLWPDALQVNRMRP